MCSHLTLVSAHQRCRMCAFHYALRAHNVLVITLINVKIRQETPTAFCQQYSKVKGNPSPNKRSVGDGVAAPDHGSSHNFLAIGLGVSC